MDCQWTLSLPTGCTVKVDENRALVELPDVLTTSNKKNDCKLEDNGTNKNKEIIPSHNTDGVVGWKTLSSAVWKGGLQSLKGNKVCVFNYRVPSTYDGLHPEPKTLLRNAIKAEKKNNLSQIRFLDENTTVGIMTATSMKSLCTASRSAGGIFVDAIVTAGISNARAAGSDADVFHMFPPEDKIHNADSSSPVAPPPGTINTVVVVNGAPLSEGAMVEAYAIALEAKCAACADMKLACAKSLYGTELAQGTGTDCAVLVCPLMKNTNIKINNSSNSGAMVLEYAGKHCLLAELIGQAVREATRAAIVKNVRHKHGSEWFYHLNRWRQYCVGLLLWGAHPCVPLRPMDPVPSVPLSVSILGCSLVAVTYVLGLCRGWLPRSATVLVAAACWDR